MLPKNSISIRSISKLRWQTYHPCLKVRYISNNVSNCNYKNDQISEIIFNSSHRKDFNYFALTLGITVTLSAVYFLIPKNTSKKIVETGLIENNVTKAGNVASVDIYNNNENDNSQLHKPIMIKNNNNNNNINISSEVLTSEALKSNHISDSRYGGKEELKNRENTSSDYSSSGMIESQFHKDRETIKGKGDHIELKEIVVPENINLVHPYSAALYPVSKDENVTSDKTLPAVKEAHLSAKEDKLEAFKLSSENEALNNNFYNDASHKTIYTDKEISFVDSWPTQNNFYTDTTKSSRYKDLEDSTNITETPVKNNFEIANRFNQNDSTVSNSKAKIRNVIGNDEVLVDEKSTDVNLVHSLYEAEDEEQQQHQEEEAYDPDTGEINWDCPCLGGMAQGPCGEEFKLAFSCFVYSETDPKGSECLNQFRVMQNCFEKNHRYYSNGDNGTKENAINVGIDSATV